jgi:hypothetical protein
MQTVDLLGLFFMGLHIVWAEEKWPTLVLKKGNWAT